MSTLLSWELFIHFDISSGNMYYEGTKEVSVLSIQHPRFYVFK